MRVLRLTVILPTLTGKAIDMDQDMSIEELERYRRHISTTFELYGFPGALVALNTFDGPGEIEPVTEHTKPKPVVIPEPDVEDINQLPQYQKKTSFFKKH